LVPRDQEGGANSAIRQEKEGENRRGKKKVRRGKKGAWRQRGIREYKPENLSVTEGKSEGLEGNGNLR